MGYKEFESEDRRLAELRFLAECGDYSLNAGVMQTALCEVGHNVSREVVLADFAFLEELGLVKTKHAFEGKVHVATLTGRGEDVAKGRTVVPGVKKPRPL